MDNQFNDKGRIKQNILFDTIIRRNSGRGQTPCAWHWPFQLQASTPVDKTTNSTDGIAEYSKSRYTYSYLTY